MQARPAHRRSATSAVLAIACALAAGPGVERIASAQPAPAPPPAATAVAAAPAGPDLPDPSRIVLDVSDHAIEGSPNAELTLVEFSDYQCEHCARHHRETAPRIAEAFIRTGKLRRVFLDLPLRSVHPFAFRAARATRCADEQGRYHEMQDALFAGPRGVNQWGAHALAAGLDVAPFLTCLDSARHVEAVRRDVTQARMAGIEEVPTFLIARTDPNDPTIVFGLSLVVGAAPYSTFEREIRRALARLAEERQP